MAGESAQETVYVVDDDASVRRSLERMFRSVGFAVEAFESAAALLARGRDTPPCCVVLDYQMPGVDGLALQARLREAGRTLPVVFLSGNEDRRSEAMHAGAIDFIGKPVDSAILIAAVRRALAASLAGAGSIGARHCAK